MKIAVTSQNRHEITEHAGRCRNFWVLDVEDVDVLIAGGMGTGLHARLARKGIEAVVTTETDPDRAVSLWLAHSRARATPRVHEHGLDHGHEKGCSCGRGCDCA